MTTAAPVGGWRVEARTGTAAELHGSWPAVERDPGIRAVAVCRPRFPALVLGSTQSEALVERAEATRRGIDVARRRSGGGAVLVHPDDPLWIDVWVPAGDPLWEPDVSRAFWWLGDVWADALRRCGAGRISVVHHPAYDDRDDVVCFGSAASGEVVTETGRKIVGLAQRRVRAGSHFHAACLGTWDPAALVDLLAVAPAERSRTVQRLQGAAVGMADIVGPGSVLADVSDAFRDALP